MARCPHSHKNRREAPTNDERLDSPMAKAHRPAIRSFSSLRTRPAEAGRATRRRDDGKAANGAVRAAKPTFPDCNASHAQGAVVVAFRPLGASRKHVLGTLRGCAAQSFQEAIAKETYVQSSTARSMPLEPPLAGRCLRPTVAACVCMLSPSRRRRRAGGLLWVAAMYLRLAIKSPKGPPQGGAPCSRPCTRAATRPSCWTPWLRRSAAPPPRPRKAASALGRLWRRALGCAPKRAADGFYRPAPSSMSAGGGVSPMAELSKWVAAM